MALEESSDDITDDIISDDTESYSLDMSWNMCQYLPSRCQEIFKVVLGGYLQALYQHVLTRQREHDPGNTPMSQVWWGWIGGMSCINVGVLITRCLVAMECIVHWCHLVIIILKMNFPPSSIS